MNLDFINHHRSFVVRLGSSVPATTIIVVFRVLVVILTYPNIVCWISIDKRVMTNFNSSSSNRSRSRSKVIGFLISPFTFFPPSLNSLSFFDCVKRTQSLLLRIFLIFLFFFVMVSWSSQLTQLLFSLIAECRKKRV